jgi:hypothetical protein
MAMPVPAKSRRERAEAFHTFKIGDTIRLVSNGKMSGL